MRILQVINSLSVGGAENFVAQLSIEMSKKHEVYLINYAGILDQKGLYLKQELEKMNVTVISLNKRNILSKLFLPFKILNLIDKISPDVIHSHLEQSDIFVAIAKILGGPTKIKYVRTIHNSQAWKRVPHIINRLLFKFYDENIACSSSVVKCYSILSCRKYLSHINNGIDLSFVFSIKKDKIFYRKKLGIPENKIIFISIGRFTKHNNIFIKGQDLLVKAINLLNEPNSLFLFLGDGQSIKEVKSQVKYNNVENALFLGIVNNVNEYLALADFIIMPSYHEGLPIAAIEAVCLSKPLISSKISAFSEFESSSHLYIDGLDAESIVDSIKKAVKEKEKYINNGIANSEYFKETFDITNCANRYLLKYS